MKKKMEFVDYNNPDEGSISKQVKNKSRKIGEIIGEKYILTQKISSSSISSFYFATDKKGSSKYVIREDTNAIGDEEFRNSKDYFITAMNVIDGLKCMGVPRIEDLFEQDGSFFIVRACLEGSSLSELMKKNGPFSERDAISKAEDLCEIYACLHANNPPIIYGGCEMNHIFILQDNQMVLLDVEYAIYCTYNPIRRNPSSSGCRPPEMFSFNEKPDPRTDIYGIGGLLYSLLLGHEIAYEDYPYQFSDLPKTISLKTRKIIYKCLQADIGKRYLIIRDLINALEKAKAGV